MLNEKPLPHIFLNKVLEERKTYLIICPNTVWSWHFKDSEFTMKMTRKGFPSWTSITLSNFSSLVFKNKYKMYNQKADGKMPVLPSLLIVNAKPSDFNLPT